MISVRWPEPGHHHQYSGSCPRCREATAAAVWSSCERPERKTNYYRMLNSITKNYN